MPGALDPRAAMHASARTSLPHLRAVPDADPARTLGPQHHAVLALIGALAQVTPEQDDAIESRWYDQRGPDRFVARGQASSAASRSGRLEAQLNARQRTWSATTLKGRDAAGDAAHALSVRDLIGPAFPQECYDQLVSPWAGVMGPVHPEDGAPDQLPE